MFKKYTGNEQFDLQITRFTYDYKNDPRVKEDLKQIVPKLKDFDSWYENWSHLAVNGNRLFQFETCHCNRHILGRLFCHACGSF